MGARPQPPDLRDGEEEVAMNAEFGDAVRYMDAMADITERVRNLSRLTTDPMQAEISPDEMNQLVHELFLVGQNVRNVVYCINNLLMSGDFSAGQIAEIKHAMSQQITLIQETVVSIKDFINTRDVPLMSHKHRIH